MAQERPVLIDLRSQGTKSWTPIGSIVSEVTQGKGSHAQVSVSQLKLHLESSASERCM